MLSHIKALEYAKECGDKYVAVFEDDIVFNQGFSKDLQFYLSKAPEDFAIMYLGGSFGSKPLLFDEYFTRQKQTWGAFAYIVNTDYVDIILDKFYRAKNIADAVLIDVQKQYVCIKPIKSIVTHPKGYSTIKEKEVNYANIV